MAHFRCNCPGALGADLIALSQDLVDTYQTTLVAGGPESDGPYLALRGRLTHLQARTQLLSLEHDLE